MIILIKSFNDQLLIFLYIFVIVVQLIIMQSLQITIEN